MAHRSWATGHGQADGLAISGTRWHIVAIWSIGQRQNSISCFAGCDVRLKATWNGRNIWRTWTQHKPYTPPPERLYRHSPSVMFTEYMYIENSVSLIVILLNSLSDTLQLYLINGKTKNPGYHGGLAELLAIISDLSIFLSVWLFNTEICHVKGLLEVAWYTYYC